MGYRIDFKGKFEVVPELRREHEQYLRAFAQTRKMKRDEKKAERLRDPLRSAVGLPIGEEGAYFIGEPGEEGWWKQKPDESILDANHPPKGQPGLGCRWIPTKRDEIRVDRCAQFNYHLEWLEYIMKHFVKPWNYQLNGIVEWRGADEDDYGRILIYRNQIDVFASALYFQKPSWEEWLESD